MKRFLTLLLTLCLLAVPVLAAEPAADDWGLTMTLTDVTSTGATIVFTQSGGSPTGQLQTGAPYWLETWQDGQWIALKASSDTWIMPAYDIPKGSSRSWTESWKNLYGELPAGVYRLSKTVSDYRGPGDYDERVYETEFTLGMVAPFTDVKESDWFAGAVRYVSESGLMQGRTATVFDPASAVTRGQIVTILWRASGSPDLENEILGYPFSDVDAASYCGTAVYWARLQGVANGYRDNTFRPEAPITREQLAAVLWRWAKARGMDVSAGERTVLPHADADSASDYALPALRWAYGTGILSGYQDGRLHPGGRAARAQAAQILTNFLQP